MSFSAKKGSGKRIRLGLISDLHVDDNETLLLLGKIMQFFVAKKVDLVVELGDRLRDKSLDLDLKNTIEIRQELTKYGLPVFHLHGNHDLRFVPKDALNKVLNKEHGFECLFFKDYQIILLDSNDPTPGLISHKQVEWLRSTTEKGLASLVFSHYPLHPIDVGDHPYFYQHLEKSFVSNHQDIGDIIDSEKGIVAVFQGHLHWLREKTVQGIPFFWVPSVNKSFDSVFPSGGITIVEIVDKTPQGQYFRIEGKGLAWEFSELELGSARWI